MGIEKVERAPVRNVTAAQPGPTEVLLSLSAPLNTGYRPLLTSGNSEPMAWARRRIVLTEIGLLP